MHNFKKYLKPNSPVITIINDKHNLFNAKLFGFYEEKRLKRHVNRRTGMRKHDFYEEILIWRNQ